MANPTHQQSLQSYQTGVQLVQEGRYEKALPVFQKLTATGPVEVLERCRIYLAVCERALAAKPLSFMNNEERCDYAISLINTGDYEEARNHLEVVLRNDNDADYAHYSLAALESLTGQIDECLEHMSKAISLNPRNRIQARTDTDFHNMIEDPRFTELLYPETLL